MKEIVVVEMKCDGGEEGQRNVHGQESHQRGQSWTSNSSVGRWGASQTFAPERTIWTLLGHLCS